MRFAVICLAISCARGETFPLSKVAELNENNWRSMLEGEWMVEFFAPWCPACKSITNIWEEFAVYAGDHGVHVAVVDVTKSPSLSGRFFVTALPTIYHVNDGVFRQYRGARSAEAFLGYIKNKQWKTVEPLSAWKQPNSIHMSVLSYFFKLSHYLKDVNTHLHEDYGLPSWGSYALFAVATIFLGALLGLILVCIVDFVYPPKKAHRQSFSETKEKVEEGGTVEELPVDELEDEESEAEEDDHESSTSEAEKNSGSDSEAAETTKKEDAAEDKHENKENPEKDENPITEEDENAKKVIGDAKNKTPSPEVRKRKARKAD